MMKERKLDSKQMAVFSASLRENERSERTVEKYQRDAGAFLSWLQKRTVTRETVSEWRDCLLNQGLSPVTVNAKLCAVNSLLRFLGWEDCRVKLLKIQRRVFREQNRDLSRGEYGRLLSTAQELGQERLALLMEAICSTGIRVSEVRFITVQAAQFGQTVVSTKGKIRTILLPNKLSRKLLAYARKQKIASGEIFLTKGGESLSRKQIWREMKALCKKAGVEPSKVFPHNLRHLFAKVFYGACRDIVMLADVLGHSSINTTRIYLLSTGDEHARQLERLGLVS